MLKPPPGEGTPWPAYPVPPFPSGEPADPATAAEITAVVRELEACANTGDELRLFAFFSDRWLAQLPRTDEIVAELSALEAATPIPVPAGHRVVFPGPWHVERLDDGRVLAAVIWFSSEDAPCLDRSRVRALLFVNHDGRWLIDDIIEHGDDFQDVASVVGTPPSGMLPPWQISCLEQDPIPPAN